MSQPVSDPEAVGYVDAPEPPAVDRAYEQILADPKYQFGTRASGELSPS